MAKPMGHGMNCIASFKRCIFIFHVYIFFLLFCSVADIYPNGGMVVQPGCKKRNLLTTWFGEFNWLSHNIDWGTWFTRLLISIQTSARTTVHINSSGRHWHRISQPYTVHHSMNLQSIDAHSTESQLEWAVISRTTHQNRWAFFI